MIEVIRALRGRRSDIGVEVRTNAPVRLFANTLERAIDVTAVECDTGMVQADSLHVDEVESIARAKAFHATLGERADSEAAHLRRARTDLVIGDIPPLAFAAAALAGVPSIAVGNFTWDWIYAGYPEQSPDVLIHDIRNAQRSIQTALRLPISAGFEGLERVTRTIPFIARHSRRERREVRRWLGVDVTRPLILLSFGAYGLPHLDVDRLSTLEEYSIVTTDYPAPVKSGAGGRAVVNVPERRLYGDGFRYEDLVRAADVVVTKPGYGIVSECIANDVAILYTSRGRFPEYDVFVREMPKFLRVKFIDQSDLLAGNWRRALEELLSSPILAERPATDGAEVAAEAILDLLQRRN